MKKIRSVFFDLDGTLVDSKEDIIKSVNQLRADLNLESLSGEEIISYVGRGSDKLLRDVLPIKYNTKDFYSTFIDYYKKNSIKYCRVYDGVLELLDSLKNYKKVLITNKSYEVTQEIIKKFGWKDTFELVYGGDSLPERKPNPYPLLKAIEELDLNKDEVLFFGDSIHDYQASTSAGIKCALATYGYGGNLNDCTQAIFIHKPLDLLNILI